MRVAAGILTIIGGLIGGIFFTTILSELGIHGMVVYIPMLLAWIGGIMALRKIHYQWALAGAICVLFMTIWLAIVVVPHFLIYSLLGLLPIILLAKRKSDFLPHEAAIQDDEHHDCLAYYQEEKKLQLVLERVGRLFNKCLGKYEDEYFQARKHRIDFWPSMDKISEVNDYFSDAATEIVKRKRAMRTAPSPALAMSSAWLAVYLDYEATKDPSNIAAGYDSMEVQARKVRQKELVKKLNKSYYKALEEEKEFRKLLKISSGEYKRITDNVTRAVASDEWLQKLEEECP